MMQRLWRLWDVDRGVALMAVAAITAIVIAWGVAAGPDFSQAMAASTPSQEWDGQQNGNPIVTNTWDMCQQPIVYRTTAIGADRALIDRGIERFADATSLTFTSGAPMAALPTDPKGGLVLGFEDGSHPLFASAPEAAGIARTMVVADHIAGAAVSVRTDQQLSEGFGPGPSEGNVLLHELGHAFGLPHSSAPESLMYPAINPQQGDGYSTEDLLALRDITQKPPTCP